jgi:hypothetical protein
LATRDGFIDAFVNEAAVFSLEDILGKAEMCLLSGEKAERGGGYVFKVIGQRGLRDLSPIQGRVSMIFEYSAGRNLRS